MASTFADLLRQRLAQGGAQTVPQGSTPVVHDPSRVEAAQRVAAALLNAKLKQVQSGGGAATPQSQMTQPQLQAAGPAYGSQAARVAANSSVPQPIIVPDIRKDTYGGLADLQAQQSAANYVPQAPVEQPYVPGYSTTPVVPQAEDIRLLESNVQLPSGTIPLTPEQQNAEKAAADKAELDQLNTLINTPGSQEQIAYQQYIDGGWSDQEARDIVIKNYRSGISGNQKFFSGITGAMNIFDMPRQAVVNEMGNSAYKVASGSSDSWDPGWGAITPGNWMIPGLDGTRFNKDFQQWAEDPANAAIIRNAYENGFQSDLSAPRFTGGQAVWELFINSAGMAYKIFADALNDPTILFGLGKKGGEQLVTSAVADAAEGKGLQAAIKYGAGNVFSAPQRVLDATIELPFSAAGKVISVAGQEIVPTDSAIMRTVKNAFQSMFAPTDRQKATDERELIEGSLEYGERVYGGYTASGPGGSGSTGTPSGKPKPPTPGGAAPNDVPPTGTGEYGYRLEADSKGWKTWVVTNPDGSVHSSGYKWSGKQTGPEKNFLENEVRRVVANLNRPQEVARLQSMGVIVPPDSWDWADPTRFKYTTWGAEKVTRDIPYRMTHDLRIPQETRQTMVDELTPAVEAHVQIMNDIDATVIAQLKKSLPEGAGEAAKQAGHDLAVPIKTMEMLRFYAEDVFPTWQKHMGAIDETSYVFRYGDTPNNADVNSLLEHAMFGSRDVVTMVDNGKGKMVPRVDSSGTASQSRRALREMGGKIEGVPAVDVARNISEQRANLFGEESLSQNASAAKSRATRTRTAAVPQEEKVEAAATDMGAGRPPQGISADTLTVQPIIDPVTVIPAKKRGAKPTAQLNLQSDDASLRAAINDPNVLTKTPGGMRIRKEGAFTKIWSSSTKDPLEVSVKITDTGNKHVVTTLGGQPIGDAQSLGEAIAIGDDFLLGRIGSPADVKASVEAPKSLIRKLDPNKTIGIVPTGTQRGMQADANFSRLIQEREGAVTGLGLDDILANRDSSPIGIALRLGVIDQETYAGLSRIVSWNQQNMPLYSAYEQLRMSGESHREAVDTLMNVLAPFPEMKAAPTWLAKWWRKVFASPDSWYMTILTAMRQQQQYNLANGAAKSFADQIGNSYTLLVTGSPIDAIALWTNPRTFWNFIKIERGDKTRLATLNHMDQMDAFGVKPKHGVLELNAGRTEAADGSEMILREKTKGTVFGDSKITGAAYGVLANKTIKDIRNAGDRNARYTHYMGSFFREIKKGRVKFYNIVRNRAGVLGQDPDEWVRLVRGLGDEFSNEDVLRVLGDERLARDWREIIGQADRTAYKSVNDKLFSYRQMKIDEKLRYVVFYHYWLSRAFLLHSKTALKNPWLMNAYLNTWEGLQNEAEEKGYPPSVIGTLRFLTSTEGFQSYINPIGITVPFDILIEQGQTDSSVADWLRSQGLFFNPIVDAALGVMGMTSRVSDLTQTKAIRRSIKAYVNWMNSNGYGNMIPDQIAEPNTLVIDPIDIIQQRITQKANSVLASVPGMAGFEQEFSQPDGYEMDLVSSILMTQMEEALGPNSNWTDAEWDQYLEAQEAILLHRDGNDYADAAVEAYSDASMEVAMVSAGMPGGLQSRYTPRDEDMALRDEGDQDARDRRTYATSGSPEDTALTVGINRLEDVGTETGRNAYSAWNEIANMDELPLSAIGTFIEIDGEQIYAGDIANMSFDERAELADRWVAQYDATEDLASYKQERDLYLIKHPEVGDFKEFQKGVYGFDGGPRAWREQYAKTDADFETAMQEKEARLRETHTQQGIIDRELDQWAASQEAYKVANGFRDSSYDAPVEPKVPDYGFTEKEAPAASGGSTGSSAPKTPIEKTKTTIENYTDKIDKAVAVMNSSGYSVTADDLIYANDYYKQAWGLFDIPSMPYDANLYYSWVLLQPNGSDTSVDAYLQVLEDSGYSDAA